MKKLIAIFGCCVLLAAQAAQATTINVQAAYGSDGPGCGPKATPCQTLATAFALAGPNDKVVVGPGFYTVTATLAFQPGMQLTSTNGASATVIDGRSISGELFEAISADKVVFGKKRKGFTVLMDGSVTVAFFASLSNRVRVEGNRIYNRSGASTGYAIFIGDGESPTVRYNTIYADPSGPFTYGLSTVATVPGSPFRKANVSDNEVMNSLICIQLVTSNDSPVVNKVSKNRFEGCSSVGIYVVNYDAAAVAYATSSKDKYMGNVVQLANGGTAGIYLLGGNPQASKNLVDLTDELGTTSHGIGAAFTTKASIKDNVVVDNPSFVDSSIGIGDFFSGNTDLTISGNSLHDTRWAVRLVNFDGIKAISKNNLMLVDGSSCSFFTNGVSTTTTNLKGNFYSPPNPGTPILNSLDCTGANPADADAIAGRLTFNPANKPNKQKFKEIFN